MCIGIPMRVIESGNGSALCEAKGGLRRIDTMLVGDQAVGTWLLTFLDTAREVLSAESAARILDALQALDMAVHGNAGIDHLFRDLVDREPQLPEFLRDSSAKSATGD